MKTLGYAPPIFPYDPPALFTVPLAFLVAITVSLMTQPRLAPGVGAGASVA